MLPLSRHTPYFGVITHTHKQVHFETTPNTPTHTRSEWKRQRVCNSHSTVWKMRRSHWVRGGLWTLGRCEEERKSPVRKQEFLEESVCLSLFLSIYLSIYQCLSLWQLLCQALPVWLSPGFNPSCGSDPSSGLTSLVHQWLVIGGGGTAGPEASRTAKCFFSVQKQNSLFILFFS